MTAQPEHLETEPLVRDPRDAVGAAEARRRPLLGPAYYASGRPSLWRDLRALLHPPYTAWHLSYVVIGGLLARSVSWSTLGATVLAFFLAVGIGAHALDELHGRPLSTAVPSSWLAAAAAISLSGAAAIGLLGVERVGAGLAGFVAVGVVLVLAYNLELANGRLHSDLVFALAWGAFPVLVSAFAQARSLSWSAVVVAAGAGLLSAAQRTLSTPARRLRRQAPGVTGAIEYRDGRREEISASSLVAPLESALRLLSLGVVALAAGLTLARALH